MDDDTRLIDIFCQFKFSIQGTRLGSNQLDFFKTYFDIVKEFIQDESPQRGDFTKVEYVYREKGQDDIVRRFPVPKIPMNTYCILCKQESNKENGFVSHTEDCKFLKNNYSIFYNKEGIKQLKEDGIIDTETCTKFTSPETGDLHLPYMYTNLSKKIIDYATNYPPNFPSALIVQKKSIPINNEKYCYTNNHSNGITSTFKLYSHLNGDVLNVPFFYEDCEKVYALEYTKKTLNEIFINEVNIQLFLSHLSSTIRFENRFKIQNIIDNYNTLYTEEEQRYGIAHKIKEGAVEIKIKNIQIPLAAEFAKKIVCKYIIRPSGIVQCYFTAKEQIKIENKEQLVFILSKLQKITTDFILNKITQQDFTEPKGTKKPIYYTGGVPNLLKEYKGQKLSKSVDCKNNPSRPFSFTMGEPFMKDYVLMQEGKKHKKGIQVDLYEPCCEKINPKSIKKLIKWKLTKNNCDLNIKLFDLDTPQSKLKKLVDSVETVGEVNKMQLYDCIRRLTELLCEDKKSNKEEDKPYCKLFRRTMQGFPNQLYNNDSKEKNAFISIENPENILGKEFKPDAITFIPGTDPPEQESRRQIGLMEIVNKYNEKDTKTVFLDLIQCYINKLKQQSLDPIDSAQFYFKIKKITVPKTYIRLYNLSEDPDEKTPFKFNENEDVDLKQKDDPNVLNIDTETYKQIKDNKIYKFVVNYMYNKKGNRKIFPLRESKAQEKKNGKQPKLSIITDEPIELDELIEEFGDIHTINELQKQEWDTIWEQLYANKRSDN